MSGTRSSKAVKYLPAFLVSFFLIISLSILPARANAAASAEEVLLTAMKSLDYSADLSSFDIPLGETGDLVYGVLARHPELFYVDSGFSYSSSGDSLGNVYFQYRDYSPEEIEAFDREVGKISAAMSTLDKDIEKVLFAHEYLLRVNEYDYTYSGYTAYDCLIGHSSVCEGYAKAFMLLMNEAGIPCRYISSEENDHAWNAVRLQQNWYFVDVTWDDTATTHKHLLNSFDRCVENGHENTFGDWTVNSSSPCRESDYTAQIYDYAPWKNARAPMSCLGSKWFFVNGSEISYYNAKDTFFYYVTTVKEHWFEWGSSSRYYSDCFTGTAVFNGKLYYSTPTAIMSISPDGTDRRTEHTLSSAEAATGYIYGIRADDTGICYDLSPKPLINGLAPVMTGHFDLGAHIHAYTAAVTEPTCTEEGFTTFTCLCGHSYRDSFVPAEGHDYHDDVAKATLTKDGGIATVCDRCSEVKSTKKIARPGTFSLSYTTATYNGKTKSPTVTVKDTAGKTLVRGTDYTVSYSNNKNIGKATAKITFKGNYSGTKTLTFKIVPGKVTGLKATQTTTTVKLTWTAVKGAKTYRIYRYSSSTGKYTQIGTTTGTSYTIKNLKAGTIYTRYVRASKTVGDVKYMSTSHTKIRTATKTLAPKTPALTSGTKNITAKWTKPAGATGCELYMKKGSSGTYKKIYCGTKLTYTKSSLTKGSTYYFRVRSYKTVDGVKIYSSYSSAKSAKAK